MNTMFIITKGLKSDTLIIRGLGEERVDYKTEWLKPIGEMQKMEIIGDMVLT